MSNRKTAGSDFVRKDFYLPETLTDALQTKKRWPETVVWAGGTHLLHAGSNAAAPTMAIHGVKELRRVVRSDTHVDIGACVPLGRLLEVGERFLPEVVTETIAEVGPPPLQNIATIGGAVCCPDCVLPPSLALKLVDTRVELRRQGNTRWIPLSQFDPVADLGDAEIVTRIRIPNRQWAYRMNHTFGRPYPIGSDSLSVIAVAAVDRQIITDIRVGLVFRSTHLVRNREAEAAFAGKRLPLSPRDRRDFSDALDGDATFAELFSEIARFRSRQLVTRFFDRLKPVRR